MTEPTRQLKKPWPFLWSVAPSGLVRNIAPPVKKRAPSKLKPIPAPDKLQQEALL